MKKIALKNWDDLQFVVGQLHTLPLLDEEAAGTDIVIGPTANKFLRLDIPLFVSDMSFGALSEEAKVALARGAELAGTGGLLLLWFLMLNARADHVLCAFISGAFSRAKSQFLIISHDEP